jgi:protein-S-isoprenylcysteine O-methyltransferase Ste14
MIEALSVTIFPVVFLILLFGGGEVFRRKKIEQEGEAPINRAFFYVSKYSILVIWAAMALQSWGIGLSVIEGPAVITGIAIALWVFGFVFLFIGRFGLGSSFRLGTPKESTSLRTGGVYRISRNPMYLGVYATVLASALYTMNPLIFIVGAFVVYVHHSIVLAEEEHLRGSFGSEYAEYCRRVRRYIGPIPCRGSPS